MTNQRLIRLKSTRTDTGRDVVNVKAVPLSGPADLGSAVNSRGETVPNYARAILGAFVAIVGALGALLGFSGDVVCGELIGLVALVLLGVGAYLVYQALQTKPGSVVVEILSSGGNEYVILPEGAEYIGSEVARVVSNQA